jgi:hypothetical protein
MRRWALGVSGLCIFLACGTSATPSGISAESADSGAPGASGTSSGGGSDGGGSSGGGSSSGGSGGSGSSSGSNGNGGSSDAGGSSTGSTDGGPSSTFLPPVQGTCPTIATGTLTFAGQQVQIWAGASTPTQPGPLVIFWYGTGGQSTDAIYFFGQTQIDAVTAAGGLVAAVSTSNKQGTDTGDGVWYTGDFATTDQVVACAIQQKWIDTSRIYTTGDSAGGLQATWMAYARSGYLAAAAPISGGLAGADGLYAAPTTSPQDPTNVPSAIVTHGAEGVDVVVIDFAVASAAYEADIASKGGFSVDCNTGGGHVSGPPAISPAIWQFFQDHPFKGKQSYGSGLPSVFPSYCQIGPREADGGP